MRKLATVRQISDIRPIPDADVIELAIVDGWQAVVKKGEFHVGQKIVYCEIDSWIPNNIAPFLSKGKEPKEYLGIKGERLRTVCLRGQLSQGLILKLPDIVAPFELCADLTEALGIIKYDTPLPACLVGVAKGNFPTVIPKTEQERCQNIDFNSKDIWQDTIFEVTEKLNGSSMTVYFIDGEFGVCSRNLDLIKDEYNSFWKVALTDKIEESLRSKGYNNIALQGELIGYAVQGNMYNLSTQRFFVFDIYDISKGKYLSAMDRHEVTKTLNLKHVPILESISTNNKTIDDLLNFAKGKSVFGGKNPPEREGVVLKSETGERISFKVINNQYLINKK
jgi:RNA ligase (TIGR02306 family)